MSRAALEGHARAEGRARQAIYAEPVSGSPLVGGIPGFSSPNPRMEPAASDPGRSWSASAGMPAALRQAVYGANGCLAAILAEEQDLVLHVNGSCMEPLLLDRERVRVTRVTWPVPGDVVAILRSDGTALMHRFLGYVWWKGRWKLMTMADSGARPDALADRGQLLGKVVAREGAPHRVSLCLRFRALGAWMHWTPRLALRRFGSCR